MKYLSKKISLDRFFFCTCFLILLSTSALKLLSLAIGWSELAKADPLIGLLKSREMLILAAGCEIIVAAVLLFSADTFLKAASIAWISTAFLAYRLGLYWVGFEGPCGCAGNANTWWSSIDAIMKVLLAYLFLGSYTFLLVLFRPWVPARLRVAG